VLQTWRQLIELVVCVQTSCSFILRLSNQFRSGDTYSRRPILPTFLCVHLRRCALSKSVRIESVFPTGRNHFGWSSRPPITVACFDRATLPQISSGYWLPSPTMLWAVREAIHFINFVSFRQSFYIWNSFDTIDNTETVMRLKIGQKLGNIQLKTQSKKG